MTAHPVRRVAGFVALLALPGCGAEEGASSRVPSTPVTVVSSIAEGDELVGPRTWTATITLSGVVHVRRVEFLVDGKVRWTQKTAPYRFSSDGMLSPWVLGAGEHELVVRVVPNPGTPVDAVSLVTVPVAPSGSAALAGSYGRDVVVGDVNRVSEYRTQALGAIGEPAELGHWGMRLEAGGTLSFIKPNGSPVIETYTAAAAGTMRVYGIARWLQDDPKETFAFCAPERDADYTWEVRGKELIVLAAQRVCADRDQVLVGTWTRTS